ncbi:energy transducer TonB [Pedobacter yonginense]|uniref:Energy transducer TonB n=1 Tax=Pedobacter yonginense TaxID=651869 RepID=A0A317ENV1_9SPHI|nr:energy transducer TonB [Pedobacter yonginense]PWS28232.1 energy transducer TonB [Pedobacter yonginense]
MTESAKSKSPSADSDNNAIVDFVKIEKQPQFPGGMQAFYQYLGQHIKYPKEAAKNKIQGKVFLTFIVEKDGALTHVEVTRGVSPEIDAEALRVISSSPKWNPGMQDGLPVRVKYNINVNFNLR